MQNVIFYIFSACLLISSVKMITAKNTVYAVLYLIVVFLSSASLWVTYAELLAMTLVIVYVGAVMVLFLFVVMMIDVKTVSNSYIPFSVVFASIVLCEIIYIIMNNKLELINTAVETGLSNSHQIGFIMYTQYSYPVELASMLLLLGLLIAVSAIDVKQKFSKKQNISAQNSANQSRLTMIHGMKP